MKNADQEGGEERGERTVTPSDSQLNVWVSLVWEGERTSYSWPARLCAAESITSEGGYGEGMESKQSSLINPNNDSPSPAKPFEILGS